MGRWRDDYDDFEWNYYHENQPIRVKDGIKATSTMHKSALPVKFFMLL